MFEKCLFGTKINEVAIAKNGSYTTPIPIKRDAFLFKPQINSYTRCLTHRRPHLALKADQYNEKSSLSVNDLLKYGIFQ